MMTQDKRFIGILITVAMLLMIPLIAMQFTDEVNWSPFDFVVMGGLLLGAGLLFELVLRKFKNTRHRIIFCAILLAAFLLVWLELAVGIFGSPFAGS